MSPLLPGRYYHIYNHANGDDNLFREAENYRFFLQQYYKHIDAVADTLAWCLMPNHFHLLVKIKNEEALLQTFPKFETLEKLLSKKFSNLFSSYTQAFNKVYQRRGSLFIKNFKRKEITSAQYLQTLVLYIHLNPVKHSFTKETTEWPWSSYHYVHAHFEELPFFREIFENKNSFLAQHTLKLERFIEYIALEESLTR
ncbi:transposase [Hydrotalea sp. AMD]|uniref:transposase n=1 Tax=Hydrotalea sp. AMD TaxID=2501297 RepID=UPI0009435D3C|nr:transposase [Hydrotalea sp. AMD]